MRTSVLSPQTFPPVLNIPARSFFLEDGTDGRAGSGALPRHRPRRKYPRSHSHADRLVTRHGRKGWPQTLHAQGDLRATDRCLQILFEAESRWKMPPSISMGSTLTKYSTFSASLSPRAAQAGMRGLIGKFMIESIARLPVEVDLASEFRYREPILDESAGTPRYLSIGRNRRYLRRRQESESR